MNVQQVRSAIMQGEVRARTAVEAWEAEFYRPDAVMQLRVALMMMDPRAILMMQQTNPEVFKQLKEIAGGRNGQ